jgi:hypothetical protein
MKDNLEICRMRNFETLNLKMACEENNYTNIVDVPFYLPIITA